ncbi:hypothetical protein LWI29_026619 [Acer saccharum]|uniref:C2H2-type domain-containing protein n=1 Tax=Acer saccharum TaxID=4024 RepID=A0AA39RE96_ACESA|nr:hypothetical protein LWI29_026619 [Acer saccharum]
MEYLCHRQSSYDFNSKRRVCFRDLPTQERMKTTTQFHSVNSGKSPMTNHDASMSSLGYTPYTVPAQQYQAAAMNPVRTYPIPCMPKSCHVSNIGALPVPCMPKSSKEESSAQDSIGLEFDPAKLRIRHESAIRALYADLPRQCTACGMRFKIQEDHRQHMDWHVRKNCAALVAESPAFFVTGDVKDEKKKPEEEVFAEEDQKACPLCMEPFDEYFSNETNDWMYGGTAYFKATKDSDRKLHSSLEGRIVHAECMQ